MELVRWGGAIREDEEGELRVRGLTSGECEATRIRKLGRGEWSGGDKVSEECDAGRTKVKGRWEWRGWGETSDLGGTELAENGEGRRIRS